MGNTFYFEWEIRFMQWLQAMMGDFLATLAAIITLFGEEYIIVMILAFLYFCYDKQFGKYVGRNIALGMVLNPLIKNIFVRRRPYFDNPIIKCLKRVDSSADEMDIAAQGFSFPSGHSMNSAIVYGSLYTYTRKRLLLIIAVGLPLLIGLSRVMLGVHFPTDVLVGWIGGLLVLFVMDYFQKKVKDSPKKRYVINLILIAICSLVFIYCKSADYYTGLGTMLGMYLAELFEERFINFENTRSIPRSILRMVGAAVVYFGLNTLIKLPFSESFRDSATMGAFLFRFIRYTIVSFITLGVYPSLFRRNRAS